jgi:hypothetical protein
MAGPGVLLLLLMGGQIGVPLGLPPAPEDPVMSRVAPQECLWYFTWSGVATPDPKSTNQTEQLLAEPEVRDFVHGVGKSLAAAIRKGAPPTPQGKLLGAEGPGLIRTLLTSPTAAFISKAGIGAAGLDIAGGIVVGTGDETDKVKATLEKLEQTLLGPAAANSAVSNWHKLPSPPGAPTIEWGFHGKYLIVGIGEGSADAISKSTEGQPPAWLVAIKKKLSVERVSTVHYLNVKKVIAAAQAIPGFAQVQTVLTALGLGNVEQFASVTGLEGAGCVSKSWVQIDGEPSGLSTLFGPEPLTAADLAPIPKDASFAIAARMKPDQLWSSILTTVSKIDAHSGEEMAGGVKQMEAALGFRLQEDLFQTLGDSWCIYNSPGEGGLLITGLTVVVPVKDHDRLVKTNGQLVDFIRKNFAQEAAAQTSPFARRMSNSIADTTFQKQKIFYLNLFGGEMPFVLSWCITDKQFIFSLSPQNIRALLSRDAAAGSLADLPDVAAKIKADGPLLLTYQDTAGMLKITYPMLQMFASMGFSEMRREGLDLDGAILPSLASLIRHIEPGMSTLSREKDGLVYVSRQSMPVDLTLSGLLPAWSGMMFMGLRESRSVQVEMESEAIRAQAVERDKQQPDTKPTTPEEDAETKEEHAPSRPAPPRILEKTR